MDILEKMRKDFHDETGENHINSQGEPDLDYMYWLEQKVIKNNCVSGDVIGSVLSKAEMQIVLPLIEIKFEDTPEGSMTHHELEHLLDRLK